MRWGRRVSMEGRNISDAATPSNAISGSEAEPGLLPLGMLVLVAGALTGLVATMFRVLLEQADELRVAVVNRAHAMPVSGFILVVGGTACCAALAAWLVRRFSPHATGSGIPQVEAVLHGRIRPAGHRLTIVKFVGGLLAIGSGLMLGREGPSVQMGSAIALWVGRISGRKWMDCRALLASGAGAGLATAFNAPIAGAVFVLEELVQRFEHRIAAAALGASAAAITVSRLMVGNEPDFKVASFAEPQLASWPLFMVLGCVAGLVAVGYNRSILGALALADSARWLPVEARAALVGALIGVIGWFAPHLVGGGDHITQSVLAGGAALAVMPAIFMLRFVLGAASYAAGTPGGLFAPMLVLGTQVGFMFGAACGMLPYLSMPPEAFAVVGMAAFFAGVVRAPLTGIILVTEMTGSTSLMLPAILASFTALMIPALLRDRPIYDSLRDRTISLEKRLGHPVREP